MGDGILKTNLSALAAGLVMTAGILGPQQASAHQGSSALDAREPVYFVCYTQNASEVTYGETTVPFDQVRASWLLRISGDGNCHTEYRLLEAKKVAERIASTEASNLIAWSPNASNNLTSSDGERRSKTIFFRDPKPSLGQKGYTNNTFDVEYEFIACSGELHLAYSVVENSVRSKTNTYLLDGSYHKVSAPAAQVENVPLKGEVWVGLYSKYDVIGTYADDHAGKALGFGCFSGQTKKIANLKDLKTGFGKTPTKEELPKLFESLKVSFVTTDIATSSAAEEEIRSGIAAKVANDYERSGQAGLDAAAADRAARKAASDARKLKYEKDLAAQQKAVADFEVAQQQVAAEKAANAARAKAVQDQFAQQQAAHQAELERHAKAQAEYEAQVAGQASVKVPQN